MTFNPNETTITRLQRASDKGFWCTLALRFGQFWDFVDKRAIDKHMMAWATFAVTCYMMFWAMEYLWAHDTQTGTDLGLKIAAILLPWTPVQGKVIQWYFVARDGTT